MKTEKIVLGALGVVALGWAYMIYKDKQSAEKMSSFRGWSPKGNRRRVVAKQCPVNCDGTQQATFYLEEGQDCPPLPASCQTAFNGSYSNCAGCEDVNKSNASGRSVREVYRRPDWTV